LKGDRYMAEKPMSNFKTAVNELMHGKDTAASEVSAQNPVSDGSSDIESSVPSASSAEPAAALEGGGMSVLSSDLMIEGTVKSKSDITLNGYIKGDVSCGGQINSSGKIDGNIDGTNITLVGSTINGNINVSGSVFMDNQSSVIGDISANSLVSDGKVEGSIVLVEDITLKANAAVTGNIKAKSAAIEPGTSIVGNMEIRTMTMSNAVSEPASASEPAPVSVALASVSEPVSISEPVVAPEPMPVAISPEAVSETPPPVEAGSVSDTKPPTDVKATEAKVSDVKANGSKPASSMSKEPEAKTESEKAPARSAMTDLLARKEALRESLNKK
jgi:cytoskeletal protein CcmA (bactofilin family)